MKKKLLQINTVVNTTSTGRITEEIGNIAIERGWESFIAFGRNEQYSNSNKIKIGRDFDVLMHVANTRLTDRHGLSSKKATKDLIIHIDKIKPDIIHLHNLHGYYINYCILFKYLSSTKTPVIWTFHDCWPITGHCTYFSYAKCEKWKSHCSKCPQKMEYPRSIFLDQSKRNFLDKRNLFTSVKDLTIVAVSKWLQNIVNESFLCNVPISVINNGVDINLFCPQNTDKLSVKYNLGTKFVILGVANVWEKRKGLDDFIELSKRLKSNETIVLVGVSDDVISNLPNNIIGIKRTEDINELAQLYSLADVFFNPTWEDNFPTTNLEAIACGTPVITYRTGGSPEALSQETGFIVEQGDIEQVISCLNLIKTNSKSSFSASCRDRAVKCFDKNRKFLEYFEIYDMKLSL